MIKRITSKKRMIGWLKKELLMNDLVLFSIHPIFLFEFIFFRWYNIKDEEICDPMEKIWV